MCYYCEQVGSGFGKGKERKEEQIVKQIFRFYIGTFEFQLPTSSRVTYILTGILEIKRE